MKNARRSAKIEKLVGGVALVLLVVFAITAQVLQSPAPTEAGSAASVATNGRRALFLLFEELGHAPKLWNRAPGRLPSGSHVLWVGGVPRGPGFTKLDETKTHDADENGAPEKAEDASEPAHSVLGDALDLHQPVHYRRFLDEGGTLIAPLTEPLAKFFVEHLGIASVATIERDLGVKSRLATVLMESGEKLEVALGDHAGFRPLADGSPARELAVAASGETDQDPSVVHASDTLVAVELPVGAGRLVLLADDSFLANSKIGAHDHALFAVRLLESLDRGGELLFDEYSLGLWSPPSPIGLASSPRWFLASAHMLALVLLFLWSQSWVRQFPRDPIRLTALSPLSRARAQGRLWLQGSRSGRAARALQAGVLARLERSVGLRPRAVGKRPWSEHVDERLGVVQARSRVALDRARWNAALVRTGVSDEALLAELAEELAGLERAYSQLHAQSSAASVRSTNALAR